MGTNATDKPIPESSFVNSNVFISTDTNLMKETDDVELMDTSNTTILEFCRKSCASCHNEARYRCPRCDIRSCSLTCVKEHKTKTGCNGIRDKAAYIPLNKFTDLDLLSDYRFLEESARMVDKAGRNKIMKTYRRETLPPNLINLQKFAWKKNRISLQFLPQTFVRRKRNRTSIKRSELHWTIEFHLPQAGLFIIRNDIASSTLSKTIVAHLLDNLTVSEKENAAAIMNASFNHLCLLMKVVGRPANDDRYIEFDMDKSLEENLRGRRLIEFPTLTILTTDHRDGFELEKCSQRNEQMKPTELPSFFRGDVDSENEDKINSNEFE